MFLPFLRSHLAAKNSFQCCQLTQKIGLVASLNELPPAGMNHTTVNVNAESRNNIVDYLVTFCHNKLFTQVQTLPDSKIFWLRKIVQCARKYLARCLHANTHNRTRGNATIKNIRLCHRDKNSDAIWHYLMRPMTTAKAMHTTTAYTTDEMCNKGKMTTDCERVHTQIRSIKIHGFFGSMTPPNHDPFCQSITTVHVILTRKMLNCTFGISYKPSC